MTAKNTYNVAVGKAVKKARLTAGKTQSEVAADIGSHSHAIYQYESGLRSISTPTAYALASSLGTSPKELYPDPIEVAKQVKEISKGNNGKEN